MFECIEELMETAAREYNAMFNPSYESEDYD